MTLDEIRAEAAACERAIDNAPDEATGRVAVARLHALMDAVENVVELPRRS